MDLREITEFFKDFMWYIIVLVIIVLVLTFVVAFQTIAGNSMNPTLKDGEIVLVSKLSYRFSDIQRNQIIIFNSNGKSYIKRVIGLPGEKVEYMDGVLYINDEPFKETYLDEKIETYNFLFHDICDEEKCPDGVIPADKYFVMGDNRPESTDSRDNKIGLIDKKFINGKVFFRVFPFGKIK